MTSLLQFTGKIHKDKGVGLEGYLSETYSDGVTNGKPRETFTCGICQKEHPVLYRFYRKPKGLFGHWVVFEFNGEEQVPDLSVPIWLTRIPRGAVKLEPSIASGRWHST